MSGRHVILKEQPARRKSHKRNTVTINLAAPSVRWVCQHHIDGSDIAAYVMATSGLEVIAQTRAIEGIDARANAELIIRAVNAFEKTQPLIAELVEVLELCLQYEDLPEKTKREVAFVIGRARKVLQN